MTALRTSWGRALAVVLITAALATVVPSFPTATAATAGPVVIPCAGASVAADFHGTFSVEGGPLPANASARVPLRVSFDTLAWIQQEPGGSVLSETCRPVELNATSGAAGAIVFNLTLPSTSCSAGSPSYCTTDVGRYGPVAVVPDVLPPLGYALSTRVANGTVTLDWVALLASVRVAPAAPTIDLSDGASTTVTASAWAGNDTPSPLPVRFTWSVTGGGWTVVPINGTVANVSAGPAAGSGNLTLAGTAVLGTTALVPPAAAVPLDGISTVLGGAVVNRTAVDAGGSVAATVVASGAANYSYRATFVPGLGAAETTVGCVGAPLPAGRTSLTCTANLAYPNAGTATPSVRVTNGYSTASGALPTVAVDPPAALAIAPTDPVGYAGLPTALTLRAAPGTGTLPFTRACLADGVAPVACSAAAGPSWTFDPTFPATGEYPVTMWAVDAAGANRSVAATVGVVLPLGIGTIALNGTSPTVGAPAGLVARVTGGDLPLRYWWNVSGPNGSVAAGFVESDGPLTAEFLPGSAGTVVASLTVADSLGTIARRTLTFDVAPAPATSVTLAVGPPAGPAVAGANVPVAWSVTDEAGGLVTAFAAPVEVGLLDANLSPVAGWVNSSGFGSLAPLGGGWFDVPAAAWSGGQLGVTVALARAGVVYVHLVGPSLPAAPPSYPIDVGPEVDRLVLFAPLVAHPGLRSNATFWHARDPFGNPVPGAEVVVEYRSSDGVAESLLTAAPVPGGGSGVWVNFTAPGPGGGTLIVLDATHHVLVGPIAVPAVAVASPPDPSVVALTAAVPAGVTGGILSALVRRRRRAGPPRDAEAALERFAAGEGQVVELVRRAGAADLRELEGAWAPAPVPPELADWVAALIADGTLAAAVGPDGVARFRLGERPAGGPRVTVDPAAFDDALERRARATREDDDRPA